MIESTSAISHDIRQSKKYHNPSTDFRFVEKLQLPYFISLPYLSWESLWILLNHDTMTMRLRLEWDLHNSMISPNSLTEFTWWVISPYVQTMVSVQKMATLRFLPQPAYQRKWRAWSERQRHWSMWNRFIYTKGNQDDAKGNSQLNLLKSSEQLGISPLLLFHIWISSLKKKKIPKFNFKKK